MSRKRSDVGAIQIFEGWYVICKRGSFEEREKAPAKALTTEEVEEKEKQYKKRATENRKKQKDAEKTQSEGDTDEMRFWVMMNNAFMRHMATFKSLLAYAEEDNLKFGGAVLHKRIREKEVSKEWNSIRRWLRSNAKDFSHIAIAVSIGRQARGWYSLRCIAVGGEDLTKAFMLPFLAYLLKKREWKDKAITVKEGSRRLRDHYKSECLSDFIEEGFELFRASLMLRNRTFRNNRAREVVEGAIFPVCVHSSYIINAPHIVGNSCSGMAICKGEVIGKEIYLDREEEEQEESKEEIAIEGDF